MRIYIIIGNIHLLSHYAVKIFFVFWLWNLLYYYSNQNRFVIAEIIYYIIIIFSENKNIFRGPCILETNVHSDINYKINNYDDQLILINK